MQHVCLTSRRGRSEVWQLTKRHPLQPWLALTLVLLPPLGLQHCNLRERAPGAMIRAVPLDDMQIKSSHHLCMCQCSDYGRFSTAPIRGGPRGRHDVRRVEAAFLGTRSVYNHNVVGLSLNFNQKSYMW
jgi:hypothetical protein